MDIRYICSVSGGKDSTCLYLWCIEQFGREGFEPVFADTGHEHPVTLNYVRHLPEMAGGPPIDWVKADFTAKLERKGLIPTESLFLDMMRVKGRAPSPKARFCTEELKLKPIKKWLEETGDGYRETLMLTGIRAGESQARAKLKERDFLTMFDCETWRPLLNWSEEAVFAMLETHGVPPNPLYASGFSRVGCFPCILARKSELALLPDWAWDKLADWEQRLGRSWFAPGKVPGEHIPTVAEVRDWSQTSRGGQQYDLFAPEPAEVTSCMANWGQCE